jgi:hypothetical protein
MCADRRNKVVFIPYFTIYCDLGFLREYIPMCVFVHYGLPFCRALLLWKILRRRPKLEERKAWPTHYGFLQQNPAIYTMH